MDSRQGDQSTSNLQDELKKLQSTASTLKDALSSVNASLMDFSKDLDTRLRKSAKSIDDEMRQLRDAVQSLRIDCTEFQRTGAQIADAIKWSMLERAKQSLALTNSFERMTDRLGVIESMFRLMPCPGMPMLGAFPHSQTGFTVPMVPVADMRGSQLMGHPGMRPPPPTGQSFGNSRDTVYGGHPGVPVILPPVIRSEGEANGPRRPSTIQDRKFAERPCQDALPTFRQPDFGHLLPANYMSPMGAPSCAAQFAAAQPQRESQWRVSASQAGFASPRKGEEPCSRCKVRLAANGSLCDECLSREDYSTASSELSDHSDDEENYSHGGSDDACELVRHDSREPVAPKNKKPQPPSFNLSNSTPVEPLFGKWKPGATTFGAGSGLFTGAGNVAPTASVLNQGVSPITHPQSSQKSQKLSVQSPKVGLPSSMGSMGGPGKTPKDERKEICGVMREGLTEKFSATVAHFRQGDKSDSQLKDSGAGCLQVFEDELGRRRILFKLATGKTGCNHFITTQTKLVINKDEENSCTWAALDFNDDEKGKNMQFSAQFKNKDDYENFYAVFNRTDRTAASNKTTPELKTDKSSSGQTAPSFLFSVDKSPVASQQGKSVFGNFSFEKAPTASAEQKGGGKTPLFGSPLKTDKLLFSGKFPGAGCSLTEIVDRSGKAGNLFGSSNDSKKAVFGASVKPLFSQSLGGGIDSSADKDDDNAAAGVEKKDDVEPDFEPTITMPASVALVTGEEGLTEKFCAKAILYRFQKDDPERQWKERGRGLMKILEEPSGRRRVLLRRDCVHKLACNHVITPKTKLTPHGQRENCFCWFAMDFSDSEKGVIEQFCARFKLASDAEAFQREFEIGMKVSGRGHPEPESESGAGGNVSAATPDVKLLDSGVDLDWICNECLVENEAGATKCVACGEDRVHRQT